MEDVSSRLTVLDFIIAVLRQHEKSLDEKLARLNNIIRQAEKRSAQKHADARPRHRIRSSTRV